MENQGERYDKIAAEFAALRDSFNTEKNFIDQFIHYLQPGAHILDIGCGSGYPIADYILKHGFKVTGIDGSKELLAIAKSNYSKMECIYGDVRSIKIEKKYDALIEWWCLFHLPKEDQLKMITRFSLWLKNSGVLEFTTGDSDFEAYNNDMLNQELAFYSCDAKLYEKALRKAGFKLLLKEYDQPGHLVWIAQKVE
jgi:2-polyprenyl-3-methyl-5-hydroxy-6-metoxy-1,4-benzoquinol methylase